MNNQKRYTKEVIYLIKLISMIISSNGKAKSNLIRRLEDFM